MTEFNEFANQLRVSSNKVQSAVNYRKHLLVHSKAMHNLLRRTPVKTGALQASWKPSIHGHTDIVLTNQMHYASFIDKGFTFRNGRKYYGRQLVNLYKYTIIGNMEKALMEGVEDAFEGVLD